MYELVIIWYTGEKEIHKYKSLEEAERAEKNMKMVFGNQIYFSCVRTVYLSTNF